jgi:hypothetical protein
LKETERQKESERETKEKQHKPMETERLKET